MGMIELDKDGINFAGESATLYADAARLVAAEKVQRELKAAKKVHDALMERWKEATSSTPSEDYPQDAEGMWKLLFRMRTIRGIEAPVIVPTDDLRAALIDLISMEVDAFNAFVAQANDPNA